MIGVITGLVIGRLWVLVRTLVCLISMMTLDSGDFAELGGFQKIKCYLWVLKTKIPPVYVGPTLWDYILSLFLFV